MLRTTKSALSARPALGAYSRLGQRWLATATENTPKKEGDISSVFRSLSGGDSAETLPQRFADVKHELIKDKYALQDSWNRLLVRLKDETEYIKSQGSKCVPVIDFADIKNPTKEFDTALRKRGVAVIRQVVPEKEAREYKEEVEKYIAANPNTKGENPIFFFLLYIIKCAVQS